MANVVLANRALLATTTTGTGTYQLGAAVTGYLTLAGAGVASGKRLSYAVVDSLTTPTVWEINEGIYTSGAPDTLSRAQFVASSTGAAINWGVGTRYIFVDLHAGQILPREAEGDSVLAGIAQVGQSYAFTASVGTTVSAGQVAARFRSDTGNTNEMQIASVRQSAGSDWTGVTSQVRHMIDTVQVGAVNFLGNGGIDIVPQANTNTVGIAGRAFVSSALRIGQNTTDTPGFSNTTAGFGVSTIGDVMCVSSNGATPAYFNTNGDTVLIAMRRSGVGVGSISVTSSATAYNTSSDRRLKDRIGPLTGAWERVKALLPRWHGWRAEPDSALTRGFIADELAEVIPQAVTGAPDAVDEHGAIIPQGVDYSKVVPDLTAALQEAMARIETLEARLAGG